MALEGFKQHQLKDLEARLARDQELLKLFQSTRGQGESPRIREKSRFYIGEKNLESAKYQEESAQLQQQLAESPSNSQQKLKTQWRHSSHQPKLTTASSLPSNNQGKDEAAHSPLGQGRPIFLAHAEKDFEEVLKLYKLLNQKGYQPWLNQREIAKAFENTKIFIACLSKTSLKKQGYVPTEVQLAFHEYAKRPSGSIYLIPLKLDNCQPPDFQLPELEVNLRELQWLDYWKPNGVENLIKAIKFFLVEYFS